MDLTHDALGAGWLVAVNGPRARVRFEGPDTLPARSDHVLDMRSGALLTAPPPPPSGVGGDDDLTATVPTVRRANARTSGLPTCAVDQAPPVKDV